MDDSEACLGPTYWPETFHNVDKDLYTCVCIRGKYVVNDEHTPFVLLTIIAMALDADISRIRRNTGRDQM